jgi:hypothetical protein
MLSSMNYEVLNKSELNTKVARTIFLFAIGKVALFHLEKATSLGSDEILHITLQYKVPKYKFALISFNNHSLRPTNIYHQII